MNTLTIEKLSKTYPNGVEALSNVSLSIQNGMFGLLGANGAGKSSLMRTIAGLQKPSSGNIFFNDENIVERPGVVRKVLGYLPQDFGVYPKVNALELLNHLATLKGILDDKERKEQINSLLHQTNLYDHRKRAVATFSGGMRRRFGIAQALIGNPQLVIVDEPTAGLDPEERNRFLNLLSEIGENVIVLLSTHIVEDVRNLCTRMAVLGDGKIISEGSPLDLINTLEGQVWSKTIQKDELAEYKRTHHILSIRLVAGQTEISVLSNSTLQDGFDLKSPTLEDFYFSCLPQSEILKMV